MNGLQYPLFRSWESKKQEPENTAAATSPQAAEATAFRVFSACCKASFKAYCQKHAGYHTDKKSGALSAKGLAISGPEQKPLLRVQTLTSDAKRQF